MPAYRFNHATGEIRYARRRVGSVRRDGDAGLYTATIGAHTFTARDATTAFREAAARAMGHESAAHLRFANSLIRQRNRVRRLSAPRPHFPTQALNDVDLIARLQRDAVEIGETPMTEEQIRATWLRGNVR